MTHQNAYTAIEKVTALRHDREALALLANQDSQILDTLAAVAFSPENELSVKACWVLDKLGDINPNALFPYLDLLLQSAARVTHESAIRPIARMCEAMLREYYAMHEDRRQKLIRRDQLESMVDMAFIWLIGPYKVAAKVYSMTSLHLLGTDFKWIHKELELILQKNYPCESPAYKARARMILAKMKN